MENGVGEGNVPCSGYRVGGHILLALRARGVREIRRIGAGSCWEAGRRFEGGRSGLMP